MTAKSSAARKNEEIYESFWEEAPDFIRYNPGARHRRRLIARIISDLPGASLLDVGCGDGTLLALVRRIRPDLRALAGADVSPSQVERNAKRFPQIDFHALDIERHALERQFDIVLCSEVIEHLEDQRGAMANLASMVAPGGRLLLTCPTGTMYATEKHFGHVRHPTSTEIEEHARAAGLRVVSLQNWGWPLYKLMKWATNVNADWALRSFASGRYSPLAKAVSSSLYWANYANRPSDDRGCQLIALFEKRG